MTNTFLRNDATFAQVGASDLSGISAGQYPGTSTNDSATAGNIGEHASNTTTSGSALSLSSGAAKTITSISLTPGDWDVRGVVYFIGAAATTMAYYGGSTSVTTNTFDQTEGVYSFTPAFNLTPFSFISFFSAIAPVRRVSLTTTTSYFLVAQTGFGTSTCGGYGAITARRVR